MLKQTCWHQVHILFLCDSIFCNFQFLTYYYLNLEENIVIFVTDIIKVLVHCSKIEIVMRLSFISDRLNQIAVSLFMNTKLYPVMLQWYGRAEWLSDIIG